MSCLRVAVVILSQPGALAVRSEFMTDFTSNSSVKNRDIDFKGLSGALALRT